MRQYHKQQITHPSKTTKHMALPTWPGRAANKEMVVVFDTGRNSYDPWALVQAMACRLSGDKPLPEPMMTWQIAKKIIVHSHYKKVHFQNNHKTHSIACIWGEVLAAFEKLPRVTLQHIIVNFLQNTHNNQIKCLVSSMSDPTKSLWCWM